MPDYGSPVGGVSAFRIDGNTGALKLVPGSPFPAGVTPISVAVDPQGPFVYVTNSGSDNVSAYTIDGTTGALKEITGSPFPARSGPVPVSERAPVSVTVDGTGRFAYVANSCLGCGGDGLGTISAYTIDQTTGALKEIAGSPFVGGYHPSSVTWAK